MVTGSACRSARRPLELEAELSPSVRGEGEAGGARGVHGAVSRKRRQRTQASLPPLQTLSGWSPLTPIALLLLFIRRFPSKAQQAIVVYLCRVCNKRSPDRLIPAAPCHPTHTTCRQRTHTTHTRSMLSSKAISPEHSHGSDAVGQMMAKYDTDKSGSFSTEE